MLVASGGGYLLQSALKGLPPIHSNTASAPTELPMLPQNMPYYRGPRVALQPESTPSDADATYCRSLLSSIVQGNTGGMSHLSNILVRFGDFNTVTPAGANASNNHKIPCLAVDIGSVEKPFQHTCLYHLQDCVVNGDYLAI